MSIFVVSTLCPSPIWIKADIIQYYVSCFCKGAVLSILPIQNYNIEKRDGMKIFLHSSRMMTFKYSLRYPLNRFYE